MSKTNTNVPSSTSTTHHFFIIDISLSNTANQSHILLGGLINGQLLSGFMAI
ncbi:hypothetical protein PGT21_021811 [Puccinia graminis f. sp. tritici]|uniref:Uncharacterized protein n=1 Tax=Puccinia graminis f. sp. tritici TaxID=56615 RepID=A0A5B0NMA6_PUCGR|nr:hypothetical protein PGT21_021811 [Puccinia graminis f. sp. tritici]KAA1090377.1 hypothetical protein PGTUg99_004173 [Puccinia graminis f. sp. tritici]